MSKRVFIFAGRKYGGECGGSAGVNYKLFLANQKYHLINNCYHIFLDGILSDENKEIKVEDDKKRKEIPNKNWLKSIGFVNTTFLLKSRKKMIDEVRKLGEKYKFNKNDIFIFHDIDYAYAFLKCYCGYETLLVYHQQGESYYEWMSLFGGKSKIVELFYRYTMKYILNNISTMAFPSNGAYECFNKTSTYDYGIKDYAVFYNGFSRKDEYSILGGPSNELVFATVSVLNDAKAVERVPAVISEIKKVLPDKKIRWILVGNGVNEKKVASEIEKYNLGECVKWIKERVSHDEILELFKRADFYIMMHNYSIFDFTTIEAMSYGVIPILSDVTANKEVVVKDNGLIIGEITDVYKIKSIIEENTFTEMKEKNISVQAELFSEYEFLKRYADYINERTTIGE